MLVYLARDIPAFVMYYVYGESRSILLIVGQIIPYFGAIDQMVIQAPNFACRLTLGHYLGK